MEIFRCDAMLRTEVRMLRPTVRLTYQTMLSWNPVFATCSEIL